LKYFVNIFKPYHHFIGHSHNTEKKLTEKEKRDEHLRINGILNIIADAGKKKKQRRRKY